MIVDGFRNSLMTTVGYFRNLTHKFSTYRNSGSLTAASSNVDESYKAATNKIETDLHTLESQFSDLRSKHQDRLRLTFEDSREKEAEIEALTGVIAKNVQNLTKQIENLSNDKNSILYQLRAGYQSRLSNVLSEFRQAQESYMRSLEKMKNITDTGDDDGFQLDDFDPGFAPSEMAQVREIENAIVEREHMRTEMLKNINNIVMMQGELRTLLYEQGTILDRIDRTYQAVVDDLEAGEGELKQAEKHQEKADKCYYIILVILLLVIFGTGIYIIIVKEKRRKRLHSNDNNNSNNNQSQTTNPALSLLSFLM